MKQILMFVISTLLLSQHVSALPHTNRETLVVESPALSNVHHLHNSVSAEADNPQVQLMNYTIVELVQFGKWLLELGSVVVRNAVHELNEIPIKSDLLQANITRMSKVSAEIVNMDLKNKEGVLKLFTFLFDFVNMMDDYENMPIDSELRITLQTALENNGYKKFESDFDQKALELTKNYENALGEYFSVLTPAERERQAKFIQWFNDFKAETDAERKLYKLSDLFAFLP